MADDRETTALQPPRRRPLERCGSTGTGGCSGGEDTAERWGPAVERALHTVTTSTPTEQRLARIRPRYPASVGSTSSSSLAPTLPLRHRVLRQSHERARASSGLEDGGDDKSIEQRAGEATLTRGDSGGVAAPESVSSSLVLSVERTREFGGGSVRQEVISRIATLRALCDEGFISIDEYERRKDAIMDELTYASNAASRSSSTATPSPHRRAFTPTNAMPLIIPHAPDFSSVVPEAAIRHVFDYDSRQWSTSRVRVALDETPFSKGSLRVVYHLRDESEHQPRGSYVAKVAIDPDEDPQTYFRDIELQAHCAHYAGLYNSYSPPKRVEFLTAWVLELSERDGVLCAVEEYIPGEYRKHNNNFGSVSDDERNTPQAFSHFTYEASNHELLAVDIQGVGDKYTDPQIHTLNGHDFGKGNLGVLGFQKFLSSHRCNSICRYLKLPAVNPKDRHLDRGTLPLQELMNTDRVRAARFDSKHYYESAPLLQKYITQCRELEDRSEQRRPGHATSRFWCGKAVPWCGCSVQ